MKKLPLILLIASTTFVFSSPAYAYLDPGTASMVFQTAVALFIGAAATGKLWWHKLKELFTGKTPGKSDKN